MDELLHTSRHLRLSELNNIISVLFKDVFQSKYWVLAETSDVHLNSTGHCYVEFIEKDIQTGKIIAKARGYIWANTYRILSQQFEMTTGRKFASGLKVLINVSAEFHSVYGYGLNVHSIDSKYTLGDLQEKRNAILQQLKAEGVLTMNKELSLPPLPQRIAVISSATAAGYEDFVHQLSANSSGFVFYPSLFPAIMQGDQTEKSIISALDKIFEHRDLFDVAVIIRGGGSTSDLASFDSYLLASNCAQFPLPIIIGIGHERDDTVLDFVAFHRAKTPTAVADYLINKMEETSTVLKTFTDSLKIISDKLIEDKKSMLEILLQQISNTTQQYLLKANSDLESKATFFKLSSPQYILKKGYSITMKDGKSIKSSASLLPGDVIETILYEGKIESVLR
ncbi:MAG: exodeoxyribonuclease VII large subunit [Dysgonamonadaceae bacterium]|jgi:exodeoxyribonuclease VII large subunit|nr:exodeoxyribonuclease VII large subunit [Dysgonamonadaceae bacterium]